MDAVYVTDPPVGNRIRAAMAYAGLSSFSALADAIGARGLRERTLRKIADEKDTNREVQRRDLIAIADATGLPYEFFVLRHTQLVRALSTNRLEAIDERLDRLEERFRRLDGGKGAPAPGGELGRRLEALPPSDADRPAQSPKARGAR